MINQYRGSVPIGFFENKEESRDISQGKSKEQTGKHPSTRKVETKRQNSEEMEEIGIAGLKKYVMTYINTVIDENDDKIRAQQRKIDFLEKRVAELSKI